MSTQTKGILYYLKLFLFVMIGSGVFITMCVTLASQSPPSPPVRAADPTVFRTGLWACQTEELYDQLSDAAFAKNYNAINFLTAENRCLSFKEDMRMTILDDGFMRAKIRIYLSDTQAFDLWTSAEKLREPVKR